MKRLFEPAGPALVAGLALLPGAFAVCAAWFHLGDWPTKNPYDHIFYAALLGVGVWVAVSLLCLRGFGEVKNADSATYEELVVRKDALKARLEAVASDRNEMAIDTLKKILEESGGPADIRELVVQFAAVPIAAGSSARATRQQAFGEACKLLAYVEETLSGRSNGSSLRWSGASGYISLWRELHRAEEALLVAELRESLYAEAVDDEARLMKTKIDGADTLLGELQAHLGKPANRRQRSEMLDDLDKPEGRVLLRKIRFVLNSYRDDLFQRFVRIRNGMFATLVYVGLVCDAILALAIVLVPRANEDAIAAGLTFYLVGALVGLFAELYGASRGQRGAVHDYGLALVRLLTIPVLSGIAAVMGVILTRLGGATSPSDVSLADIFSLTIYPFGIVIAAIFGLTPGLLLERLRTETNAYKEELVRSAAGTPAADTATSSETVGS